MSDKAKTPTYESLVSELTPGTAKRLIMCFQMLPQAEQDRWNKIIEWAYEKGKVDALKEIRSTMKGAK